MSKDEHTPSAQLGARPKELGKSYNGSGSWPFWVDFRRRDKERRAAAAAVAAAAATGGAVDERLVELARPCRSRRPVPRLDDDDEDMDRRDGTKLDTVLEAELKPDWGMEPTTGWGWEPTSPSAAAAAIPAAAAAALAPGDADEAVGQLPAGAHARAGAVAGTEEEDDWDKEQKNKEEALHELEAGLEAAANGPPHKGAHNGEGGEDGGEDDDDFSTAGSSSLDTEAVVAYALEWDDDDVAGGQRKKSGQPEWSADPEGFQTARDSARSLLTTAAYFASTGKAMLTEHKRAQKEADLYMSEVSLATAKLPNNIGAVFYHICLICQGMEWLDRAGRALRRAKEEGSKLWPLYKQRCAELRAVKKVEKKKDSDLAALKAENEALRARAEAAEREAELAVRRRSELQDILAKEHGWNQLGDPQQFGSSTSEDGSGVAFARGGRR